MAGYIGSKSSVTLVDGYTEAEADAEFVNDPSSVITVSGSNVGIGTSSPEGKLHVYSDNVGTPSADADDFIIEKTGDTGLSILSTSTGRIYFGDVASNDQGSIRYVHGDNSMRFETDSAERMRIDSSGNVGIGASSPSNQLHLQKSADNGVVIENTTGATLSLLSTGAGRVRSSGVLLFDTGGATERMRIDSSGNVLVGTTTTGFANDNGFTIEANSVVQRHANGVGSGTAYAWFTYNGGAIGSITQNGTTSVSYNTSSDYRLKESWVLMVGASERVLDLKPVNFAWKADGKRVDGFLAHELADVVPEAVTGTKDAMRDEEYEVTPAVEATYDEDGNELTAAVEAVMGTRSVPDYQGIDQSKLVPLLTAALQEALTEIASLKTRVEALEA